MENKDGVKVISDKIEELHLLGRSYAEAITIKDEEVKKLNKEIDQYLKNQDELFKKIRKYQEVLADLTEKPIVLSNNTAILNTNPNTGVTDINHPNNKNVTPTCARTVHRNVGIVCKNSDDFINYINKIKKISNFKPIVKDTIVEQSDHMISYYKVSGIFDVGNLRYHQIITTPFAVNNPDYGKIIELLKR